MDTVLGAAGTIGRLLVPALQAHGVEVRAVTRRGTERFAGAETIAADVSTADGADRAVAGARTVYVTVQPPYTRWAQEFPSLVTTIADAATRAGARLVMLDNLYGYGPTQGPMTEATPQRATSVKGRVRAAIARDLLARPDLQVAIGRASDFVGPHAVALPVILALEPVAAGKKGRWLGRLDQPHSLSYTPDVAAGLAALGTSDAAFGRVWHLPVTASPTGEEFVTLAHRLGGVDARPGLVTPLMNRIAGLFKAEIREGNELMDEWTKPFVVDDSAFRAQFPGTESTPLEQAVGQTLAAIRAA